MHFSFNGDALAGAVKRIDNQVDRGMAAAAHYHSARAQGYARANAPWTDRSTNARNGLFAKVNRRGPGSYQIVLFHTMPYGVWLEIRWSGRYAIIRPTIDHEGPEVMRTVSQLFGSM